MKEYYDKLYSSEQDVFVGGKPEAVVLKAIELLPNDAIALEIGAGQGRNALALAEKGLKVKAIDISDVGIKLINESAKKKGLKNLKAEVGNALDGVNGNYDLIVTTFMLHHLTKEKALNFIDEMKSHTNNGGLNAISTFTNAGAFAKLKSSNKSYLPKLGELKELYSDWEVLEYSEKNSMAKQTYPDGTPMFNIKATILARKSS